MRGWLCMTAPSSSIRLILSGSTTCSGCTNSTRSQGGRRPRREGLPCGGSPRPPSPSSKTLPCRPTTSPTPSAAPSPPPPRPSTPSQSQSQPATPPTPAPPRSASWASSSPNGTDGRYWDWCWGRELGQFCWDWGASGCGGNIGCIGRWWELRRGLWPRMWDWRGRKSPECPGRAWLMSRSGAVSRSDGVCI